MFDKVKLIDGIAHLKFVGNVSTSEVFEAAKELNALEKSNNPTPDKIVDITEITGTHLEFKSLSDIAKLRSEQKFTNVTRAAIVVEGPFQYGFARMWQAVAARKNIEIEICNSTEEALAWIASPREEPDD